MFTLWVHVGSVPTKVMSRTQHAVHWFGLVMISAPAGPAFLWVVNGAGLLSSSREIISTYSYLHNKPPLGLFMKQNKNFQVDIEICKCAAMPI